MNQENKVQYEENIDIRHYLIKILANWPLFIISLVIAYAIAYLINRYNEPIYGVSSTLLINEDKKSASEALLPALDKFYSRRNVENEMSILKSYTIAHRTLSELDFTITYYTVGRVRESVLYKSCFFNVKLDSTNANRKNHPVYITVIDENKYLLEINSQYNIKKILQFGEPFKHPDFNFTIFLNKDYYRKNPPEFKNMKIAFVVNDLNSLTNRYVNKLSVSNSEKKGTILTLSTYGPNPKQEADYLNKLSEVYIMMGLEEKNRASTNAIEYIDTILSTISDSLKLAELKLQKFRLENPTVMYDLNTQSSQGLQGTQGSPVYDRLKSLQSDKAIAEMQLKYCYYLKNYIESKNNYNDIVAPSMIGINEPVLSSVVNDLIQIYDQKASLSYSAQNDNPSINIINLRIQKALEAIKENINQSINTTNLNLKNIENNLLKEEIKLQQLPITEQQLLSIQRVFDINNNIYTFLLQKRAEAGIAKASNMPDNKVIDVAMPENAYQISPRRTKNYMTAILIGGIIPLIIIILTEYFNTTITDLREFEKLKHCNVIGTIGHNDLFSELPVFENPKSSLSESFRSLRTNLQYLLVDKDEKVIMVTSAISGEGKTFCAVNIATILALSDKKTIIVGLDLRKPKIHKLLNLPNDKGISTYLINKSEKEEIIFATNIKNLYALTSGPIPPNPAELLETEKMETLIKELKKEYDYIIIDTPPITIVTDAFLASKFVNTTILVIRQNLSSKNVLYLADDISEKGNLKKLNILINDIKIPSYYGYSYKYGYRYGYGYGYGYSYYNYNQEYYGDKEQTVSIKDRIKKWMGI